MNADLRPETPPPAANAVKHGFCAAKFLAPDTLAMAETIQADLIRIHEPWSDEETEAIAQASLARAQHYEIEQAMIRKVACEKARAAELYERSALDRFHADLIRYREIPAQSAQLLGMTWHGATWFQRLWGRVASDLAPEIASGPPCLPFALACDAAMALGSTWQVDQAGPESAWLMARYVRIAPDPEAALALWVDRSNAPDGRTFALAKARKLLSLAPADPAVATIEMAAVAAAQSERWSRHTNALRTDYETARDSAAESAVGTGSGDPALEREFRLLSRYLTSARNRADRLQRRVDTLKKERKSLAYKLQRDAEREARRLKKESDQALRRYESESAQIQHEREAFFATTDIPEYENLEPSSCTRDGLVGFEAPTHHSADVESPVVTAQAFEPNEPDSPQTTRKQGDNDELRNGSPPLESTDGDAAPMPGTDRMGSEPACCPDPASPRWMDRDAPFRDRIRMIRYRDWSDPAAVFEDEIDLLKQFVALPQSFERSFAVTAFFGSEKVLRRCWKAYRSWAAPEPG